MTTVRNLYRCAVHGAGAEDRWAARDALDMLAASEGTTTVKLLQTVGLDMAAFFASRPISRPKGPLT